MVRVKSTLNLRWAWIIDDIANRLCVKQKSLGIHGKGVIASLSVLSSRGKFPYIITSNQVRLRAEFKHINKRRKRNQQGFHQYRREKMEKVNLNLQLLLANCGFCISCLVDHHERSLFERSAIEGDSPVLTDVKRQGSSYVSRVV